jgi:hypothetical protein
LEKVLLPGQFNHFGIPDIISVDNESDEGAYFVPSLPSGGARVNVEAAHLWIVLDFEDM